MQLRPYQLEAKNSIFEYFQQGKTGNPLVSMPTGTGKSLVIADFIKQVMEQWPNQRILVMTHVKELLVQNSDKLKTLWPRAPYGIYSAGLNQKEVTYPITFAGIASAVKVIEKFGHIDLMLIDEAHLLSPKSDTMYGKAISKLKEKNPYLKVIGFTATPYRVGQGLLTNEGGIFTDICYDISHLSAFNKLIADGWLATLIPKRTVTAIDISNVGISNGDYNAAELEATMDVNALNYQVCKEMVQYASDREKWLIFAAGVKHANHIADMLKTFGISAVAVHSKMGDGERDKAIENFKSGSLRCIVNNNVLTTGFDCPSIDFIGMLRPTMSCGLWVQMLGRGTRPSPGKQNCLVLDFAGNTKRLGPINDPLIPKQRGKGKAGVAPIKICDKCGVYNHANATFCDNCGFEFPRTIAITRNASDEELIKSDSPTLEWFKVSKVTYAERKYGDKPPLLKVTYHCGTQKFDEVVCLEHPGEASRYARDWWCKRMGVDVAPPSIKDALQWTQLLKAPKSIKVWMNCKPYKKIMQVEL